MKKKNIKKPNNNKVLIIAAAVILAIGIAYLSFSGLLEGKISQATINKLAKDADLKILTESEERLLVSYDASKYYNDNNFDEESGIYLELEDGKIYLTNQDNKSRITGINEKIIFMINAANSCWGGGDNTYLLTENKNLYILYATEINSTVDTPMPGNGGIKTSVYNKIKNNEEQELHIKRINGNKKVLAFTKYEGDGRGISCGGPSKTIYTSDKKIRVIEAMFESETANIDTIHTGYIGNIGYFGLLEYPGNKLGITGEEKLKNSAGDDLVYKKVFWFGRKSGLKTRYVIVDENNDIYIETAGNYKSNDFSAMEDEVTLYSDTIKYVSYSSTEDLKLTIILSDGKNLVFETEILEIK